MNHTNGRNCDWLRVRLIEFDNLIHTHGGDQENQGEDVKSPVAPPHDCHAVKEEGISNDDLEQIETDAEEACDTPKRIEWVRAATRTALLDECPDNSDTAHRKVLSAIIGVSQQTWWRMVNEVYAPQWR